MLKVRQPSAPAQQQTFRNPNTQRQPSSPPGPRTGPSKAAPFLTLDLQSITQEIAENPLGSIQDIRNAYRANEGGANRKRNKLIASTCHFAKIALNDDEIRNQFYRLKLFLAKKRPPKRKDILRMSLCYTVGSVTPGNLDYDLGCSYERTVRPMFDRNNSAVEIERQLNEIGKETLHQLARFARQTDLEGGGGDAVLDDEVVDEPAAEDGPDPDADPSSISEQDGGEPDVGSATQTPTSSSSGNGANGSRQRRPPVSSAKKKPDFVMPPRVRTVMSGISVGQRVTAELVRVPDDGTVERWKIVKAKPTS